MFGAKQIEELVKPLAKSVVKRNPKGFDYVEGWHAIAEANRIFGFDGWNRETLDLVQLGEPQQVNGNWRVAYRCRVRVTVYAGERIITRDGTGYGSGIVKDIRDAHEGAVKEAETDAMKRALMTFGNPFGLGGTAFVFELLAFRFQAFALGTLFGGDAFLLGALTLLLGVLNFFEPLAFGFHAPIDRFAHFARQFDPFQSYVDNLHTDLARIGICLGNC